jgi:RNA polymerase sigma-70 factor (ECF subfamily)
MNDPDSSLIHQLKNGDVDAYRTVFIEHYPPLLNFAHKIIRDEDLAKDVVQNVFIKMFASRDNLTVLRDLKSYLFAAVRNECLNLIRKETRVREHHHEFAINADDKVFSDAIEEVESEHRIYKAIRELPPQTRRIFTMSRLDDKKNQEIATELGISIRTVETQISNALKALRKSLLQFLFF